MTITDTDLTYPQARGCPFDPPAVYGETRDRTGIERVRLPNGTYAWLVTRHEDVRAMLTDPRFSADRRNPAFPLTNATRARFDDRMASMITMDGEEHSAARREVISEFTVRRMRALEPRIQQIVDGLIDQLLAGPRPVDLVPALCLPVPSRVICELLGVPYSDHDFFESRTARMVRLSLRSTDEDEIRAVAEDQRQAAEEVMTYLSDLISAKLVSAERGAPTDDLLGRRISAELAEKGEINRERMTGLAFLLLVAGHETTANMISLGTTGLLSNPDQLAAWRAREGGTEEMVEELLRYFTIVENGATRVAVEDVELGGVRIRAGEGVLGLTNVANRDPSVFTDPDELRLDRANRNHMSFGFGPHQCLGQNLARMELRIVFDTLFTRLPDLRLAVPFDELTFKDEALIYGMVSLPVTW